jgi:thioesterase domain-containing protein
MGMHELAEHLGAEYPLWTFQLDLSGGRRPGRVCIPELAAHFIRDLQERLPHGPYHLGGCSFGGVVAFEMARQLQAQGAEIGLVLFDAWGPRYPRWLSPRERIGRHLETLRRFSLRNRAAYVIDRIASRMRRAKQALGRLATAPFGGGTPQAPTDPRYETLRRASMEYFSEPRPFAGGVVLFRASERPQLTCCTFDDPENGWGAAVSGEIDVQHVAGNHLSILREPGISLLAGVLKDRLKEVGAPSTGFSAQPPPPASVNGEG